MTMAATATERTICPQGRPMASGTEPMARLYRRLGEIGDHTEKPFPSVKLRPDKTEQDAG